MFCSFQLSESYTIFVKYMPSEYFILFDVIVNAAVFLISFFHFWFGHYCCMQ